jgi:hypothetical protein
MANSRLQQIRRVLNHHWRHMCFESPYRHQHSLLKAGKSKGTEKQQQRRSVGRTGGTRICMIMGTAPWHWRRDAACLLLHSAGVSKHTPTLPSQVSLQKKHFAEMIECWALQCERGWYSVWSGMQGCEVVLGVIWCAGMRGGTRCDRVCRDESFLVDHLTTQKRGWYSVWSGVQGCVLSSRSLDNSETGVVLGVIGCAGMRCGTRCDLVCRDARWYSVWSGVQGCILFGWSLGNCQYLGYSVGWHTNWKGSETKL